MWMRHEPDQKLAEAAAEKYHKDSVLGNMSLFRRFIERSMKESVEGADMYVDRLVGSVLTKDAGNRLVGKFRRVFGSAGLHGVLGLYSRHPKFEQGIKVVMGFLRKRSDFRSHFADDDALWVPGGRVGVS
jgi:hypothetical protein